MNFFTLNERHDEGVCDDVQPCYRKKAADAVSQCIVCRRKQCTLRFVAEVTDDLAVIWSADSLLDYTKHRSRFGSLGIDTYNQISSIHRKIAIYNEVVAPA